MLKRALIEEESVPPTEINPRQSGISVNLLDCGLFVLFFAASMFFGWLLTLAYPYGLTNYETGHYELLANKFQWFQPNPTDWFRTIPYGLILDWSKTFENPSIVSFWICTTIFSVCMGLVYVLGRCLFSSRISAALMASLALLFEIVSMHVFFDDLRMCAEPIVAVLIHAGALLAAIGWLSRRPGIFLLAYSVLGIVAFIKPEAFSLFAVWLPFALLSGGHWTGKALARYAIVCASIGLLFGPVAFWSGRNFALYGYPKTSACGGMHILQSVLHLVEDKDVLFNDSATNEIFIATLRRFDAAHGNVHRRNLPPVDRCRVLESYLFQSRWKKADPPGPLDVLAQVVKNDRNVDFHDLATSPRSMFQVESEAARVAIRIVMTHPWEYLRQVLCEYTDLWTPYSWWGYDFEQYFADPRVVYKEYNDSLWPQVTIYPGSGRPSAASSNISLGLMFGSLHESVPVGLIVGCLTACQAILPSIIFVGAIICLVGTQTGGTSFYHSEKTFRIAVILILLYATQMFHFGLVSLVHVQRNRYGIIGDMGVHLMYIITLVALTPAVLRRLRLIVPKITVQEGKLTSWINLPMTEAWRTTRLFVAVFLIALIPAYIVSAAYPYGFTNAQSMGLFRFSENFSWFSSQSDEWYATLPGAIILAISSWFSNPSNWLYWLYAVMFASNIGLFSLATSTIFKSRRAGFVLSLAVIALEFLLMRVSYFQLQIDARPFYAHLSLMGGLLALLGCLWHSRGVFIASCAVLGIASLTAQPEGCSLLYFWALFMVVYSLDLHKSWREKVLTITTCGLLLLGPVLFWSLRNWVVYGYAVPCGCQGLLLLNDVSPLTKSNLLYLNSDEEAKLSDSESLRRGWLSPEIIHHIQSHSLLTLHETLAQENGFYRGKDIDADSMFVLNDAASYTACQIIRNDLKGYLTACIDNYVRLFSTERTFNPLILYQGNPENAYSLKKLWAPRHVGIHDWSIREYKQPLIDSFYQRISVADIKDSHPIAATALGLIQSCTIVSALRAALVQHQFLFCHIILFTALLFIVCTRSKTTELLKQMRSLAMAILLILTPAVLNLIYVASVTAPLYPYLMESELSIHLAIVLTISALIFVGRAVVARRAST